MKRQTQPTLEDALEDLESQRIKYLMKLERNFYMYFGDMKTFRFLYENMQVKYNQLKMDLIKYYNKK